MSTNDTLKRQYAHGVIQPLLHRQYLSHSALHRSSLPLILANLSAALAPPLAVGTDNQGMRKKSTVVIVGVEYGKDLSNFAEDGHKMIAFEPMPHFYSQVSTVVQTYNDNTAQTDLKWDVDLRNVALGNSSVIGTTVNLHYRNFTVIPVNASTLDVELYSSHNDHDICVMSVDVQGFELSVIQGGLQLLKRVRMIWFEVGVCSQSARTLFDVLDKDFVLFDFVPVGKPKDEVSRGFRARQNFLLNASRPASFDGFHDWLCGWRRDKGYVKVQTDVVAVRRDVVHAVLPGLESLGVKACGGGGVGVREGERITEKIPECRLRLLDNGFVENS